MSVKESYDWTIEEQQNNYFLGRLRNELKGEYRCRQVLRAEPGTTVLFQYRNHIIASAVLAGSRKLSRRDRYGYSAAMLFDPATIRVFAPLRAGQMHRLWRREFKRFTHAKQTLSHKPLYRFFELARPPSNPGSSVARKLARLSYNSAGWHHPTGDARKYETRGTYNQLKGFGHEDWLFRNQWEIDGWRYGFIQAANGAASSLIGQPIDVTLFTILPDGGRQMVAHISELECLNSPQAKRALAEFKKRGWYQLMREEVGDVDGDVRALADKKWAPDVLNVRFRAASVTRFIKPPVILNDQWLNRRWRYTFFPFPETRAEQLVPLPPRSSKGGRVPSTASHFRRGSPGGEVSPEHAMMQEKLRDRLIRRYGRVNVLAEVKGVDLCVRNGDETILYEIKSDAAPRAVIRQALGQILEYAFFRPGYWSGGRIRLVIVGRNPLGPAEEAYFNRLQSEFKLPLSYQVVKI